jgi:uncharacterized protein (DUF885 family)
MAVSEFVRDFHELLTRDPNERLRKGVDRGLGELPDPSRAARDARVAATRALLARCDELRARPGHEFDTALDLDLAALALGERLQRDTRELSGRPEGDQLPRAGDEIGDGLFLLLVNDPRPAGERLADITARLAQVPAYLASLLGRLDTPVARWVAMELDKVAGLPTLFGNLVDWAEDIRWPDRRRLEAARRAAEAALTGYAAALAAMPRTTQLHLGDAGARAVVYSRGIELELDALHALAREFLATTGRQIDALRARLAPRYGLPEDIAVDALHRHLNRRYRVEIEPGQLVQILDRYQRERERISAFIRERDLFPIPAAQDMVIMQTPPFMAPSIPAGAMMSPPPFRTGARTSLVYLTLSDELLDEHTELSIPGMMIHEGIPGHHLQLATAAGHPSVIRRHIDAMDHAEGWTTMMEDYMLDQGYLGELEDEARFCGKRDLSRIGARVAIDLFFMTGERRYLEVGVDCDLSTDDPFTAAGNLLAAVTGFVPGRVEAELNWYSQERGYPLSYLTGNRLAWQLKDDVRAANPTLAASELDRTFHRVYLESGNMPVSFLRRVFAHQGLLPAR